jgi:putative acetyltransferase
MEVREGGLDDPRVQRLLELHVRRARAETARGSAHALDLSGLKGPGIEFWTVWEDEQPLGTGALKSLGAGEFEVKSMYTAEHCRRRGIGSVVLTYLIAVCKQRRARRISLETGSWEYFRPAVAFYRKHGFVDCAPFAGYLPDPNSIFLTLDLEG